MPCGQSALPALALSHELALAAGGAGGLPGALSATRLGARFGTGRIVTSSIVGNGVAWAVVASGWHGWVGWVVYAAAAGFGLVSAILAASPYRHARLDGGVRAASG